jgi:hypothetical protein
MVTPLESLIFSPDRRHDVVPALVDKAAVGGGQGHGAARETRMFVDRGAIPGRHANRGDIIVLAPFLFERPLRETTVGHLHGLSAKASMLVECALHRGVPTRPRPEARAECYGFDF